jgi:hypothetical protein
VLQPLFSALSFNIKQFHFMLAAFVGCEPIARKEFILRTGAEEKSGTEDDW